MSRVSLATGVTASEGFTYANTSSPPSTPEILPQAEQPVPPNHYTSGPQVPSELPSQSRPPNFNQPPCAADLTVDQVLARVRSGVDIDQLTFAERNIKYWNLWNIDRVANPHLYSKSSNAVDDNYEPPDLEDSETREEEEEEEENPLPIPDPLGTHLTTQELELFSTKQLLEIMNYKLDRHLGTIIEETFQQRTTLELE